MPLYARLNEYDFIRDVLESIRNQWSGQDPKRATGTTEWGTKNVEWLLVSIITKLHQTGSIFREESFTDPQSAYAHIVRDLVSLCFQSFRPQTYTYQKRRRGSPFKRYESVDLVRQYIACMDEISLIHEAYEHKVVVLQKLLRQWEYFEQELALAKSTVLNPENPEISMSQQIQEAIDSMRRNKEKFPRMLTDLKSSLDVVSTTDLS